MRKTNFKNVVVSLLALIMLCVSVFFPSMNQVIYAFADGSLEEYLTGNEVSDEYMEEVEDELAEKYQQYLYLDGDHVMMHRTPLEDLYAIDIFDYSIDPSTYVYDESHIFDIVALRMIKRNLQDMNDLVDEDLGIINENFEFVLETEEDTIQPRWLAWNFQLSWNKFNVNFDSDFAIAFSMVFLTSSFFLTSGSFNDSLSAMRDVPDLAETVIGLAIDHLPSYIHSYIYPAFDADTFELLAGIVFDAARIIMATNIVKKVIQIIFERLLPTVTDCMVVLYNAIINTYGMELKFCWIPTWTDRWGFRIRSI